MVEGKAEARALSGVVIRGVVVCVPEARALSVVVVLLVVVVVGPEARAPSVVVVGPEARALSLIGIVVGFVVGTWTSRVTSDPSFRTISMNFFLFIEISCGRNNKDILLRTKNRC